MQCDGCQQLKAEIFELKSFIAQRFDKVFDRFNENDQQFMTLKTILKDAVGEEYSSTSVSNHHQHRRDNNSTNSSIGHDDLHSSLPFQKKRKIDANLKHFADDPPTSNVVQPFNLTLLPANLIPNLNVSSNVGEKSVEQQLIENIVSKALTKLERGTGCQSAVVLMEDNFVPNSNPIASAVCQYSQLTPLRLENNSIFCSQSNCKTEDKGKRVNWNKLDPTDPQGRCPYCAKQFTRVFSVRRHINTLHASGTSAQPQDDEPSPGTSGGGGSGADWQQQHPAQNVDSQAQNREPAVSQYF